MYDDLYYGSVSQLLALVRGRTGATRWSMGCWRVAWVTDRGFLM